MIFNLAGQYGPYIMFLISLYHLWGKYQLVRFYTFGLFVSISLNTVLKYMIKDRRPDSQADFGMIKDHVSFLQSIRLDPFGMPSGHSQNSMYSAVFIYLATQDIKLSLLFMAYTALVMTQRVLSGKHYVAQVIVGAAIGGVVAATAYYACKHSIKGYIIAKIDDFAKRF